MNEAGKKLRRLGLAAVFVLAATAAAAQTQQLATGQRNLACGSPASIGDGWPTATPESVGLDGERLCGIAARLKGNQRQRSCRGHRPSRQAGVRAVFPRL